MKIIHKLRKEIISKRISYLHDLKKKDIDASLSSLSSFRTLLFNNFSSNADNIKNKNIKKKINKINFIYQTKNFLYISRFSDVNIIGDVTEKNLKKYNRIIVVWSKAKDFSKDGEYYNNYFNISSARKDNLWFLIHADSKIPKKIKKNIIILNQQKTKFGFNIFLILKYFFKILIKRKFILRKVYHELSFDSLIANNVKKFFNEIFSYYKPSEIIFPFESQPFQNALIHVVKNKKKDIRLIGYDHSSNPFPIYNTYNFDSPDILYVHSQASKIFYSKYLKWPKKKVIKIASLRINRKKSKEFKNKIFLPYDFYNIDEITSNFKLFLNCQKEKKIKPLKVKIHPSRLNSKKHLILQSRIKKIIKNHRDKFSKNSTLSFSIHVGNTSTAIEALESGSSVIHIVSDPIFDLFSSQFWPALKVDKLSNNVFKYTIKKLGKCLIFKNKSTNFQKIHK